MKLHDLFEEQKVIDGDVDVPRNTVKLDYKNTIVKGYFDCSNSKITSLEGAPKHVDGHFSCFYTNITSLKGAPSYVGKEFNCFNTKIKSLEGAPSYIGGGFYCFKTFIVSLHNIHKHIKHIGPEIVLPDTIKSHVIGIMLVKGIDTITFFSGSGFTFPDDKHTQVSTIINNHLQGDRDIHQAQEELIEAGLKEYAQL